jgi:mRNA-degrading endonuclease toxin of MazEF toxin-antitoxin module
VGELKRGRIVWVELPDPQGRNPKIRPAVVLTPTADIKSAGTIQVAAITGETTGAPPESSVFLPWLKTGHPKTGLSKPSVAVASWVVSIPVSAIQSMRGIIPTQQMLELLGKCKTWYSEDPIQGPLPPPPETN